MYKIIVKLTLIFGSTPFGKNNWNQSLPVTWMKCVLGHCPAGRPMTSGGDAAFWNWPLCCAPKFFGNHQISWYRSHSQGIQCQKQQSNPSLNLHHVWLWGRCSFLWEPHFFFYKQCHDVLYQKSLILSHLSTVRSPRRIVVLSHKFWQTPGFFLYAFVSTVVSSLFIQMATDSASWHCCTLCLQISVNLFGS